MEQPFGFLAKAALEKFFHVLAHSFRREKRLEENFGVFRRRHLDDEIVGPSGDLLKGLSHFFRCLNAAVDLEGEAFLHIVKAGNLGRELQHGFIRARDLHRDPFIFQGGRVGSLVGIEGKAQLPIGLPDLIENSDSPAGPGGALQLQSGI